MALSPRNMPANTDGQAHLFFTGGQPIQILAVSNTGCIAIQSPGNPIKVYHWYFRAKGKEPIKLAPVPWAIVWSCRAPWNVEQCGFLTRLQVETCGLTQINVRDLKRLRCLWCAGNVLERLDCSGMSSLKSLNCSGNRLTSVDVQGCSQLLRLRVVGNGRLRISADDLLAQARGEPMRARGNRLTATSLFDL